MTASFVFKIRKLFCLNVIYAVSLNSYDHTIIEMDYKAYHVLAPPAFDVANTMLKRDVILTELNLYVLNFGGAAFAIQVLKMWEDFSELIK
uniref:Uncharacterized protein n=1 Tax=Nelumbo nucifera TaxID=4432 RepID=A0A822XUJ2_NELNU|nr:TPA_asm: hypothetical protein HUJ06_024876 [Nelumbo nucifera]